MIYILIHIFCVNASIYHIYLLIHVTVTLSLANCSLSSFWSLKRGWNVFEFSCMNRNARSQPPIWGLASLRLIFQTSHSWNIFTILPNFRETNASPRTKGWIFANHISTVTWFGGSACHHSHKGMTAEINQ